MARPTLPPRRPVRTVVRRLALAELGGAPVALPAWVDGVSDRWWGLPPRTRTVLAVAVVVAVLSGGALRAAASPYGPPVAVLVAREDLAAGTVLDATALRSVRWPADLLPHAPRTDGSGTLTAPLPAGAVLTDAHVTVDGLGGLVGAGHSAVPLPTELVPQLPVGTGVQVVATAPDGTGVVLADAAEVVAHEADLVWLAVPEGAAAQVAAAGARGTVTLTVRSVSWDP